MVRWRSPTVKIIVTSSSVLSNDDYDSDAFQSSCRRPRCSSSSAVVGSSNTKSITTTTLTIPTSGYYGFCLEKCSTINSNNCTCHIVLSGVFVTKDQHTRDIATTEEEHLQWDLPFADVEQTPLMSMHLGRAIYVSNDEATVTVTCTHCKSCQDTVERVGTTTRTKKKTTWKWCMVRIEPDKKNDSTRNKDHPHTSMHNAEAILDPIYDHYAGQNQDNYKNEKDTITDTCTTKIPSSFSLSSKNTMQGGEMYARNTIVCALCGLLHDTCRDVKRHLERSHAFTLNQQEQLQKQKQQQQQAPSTSSPLSSSAISKLWTTPLKVVYQDDALAVVNKPQGMAVMGAEYSLIKSDLLLCLALNKKDTATTSSSIPNKKKARALRKPVPVHRLDSATGGLLVVAKTKETEILLKDSFSGRTCHKRYRALVCGRLVVGNSTTVTTDNDNNHTNESGKSGESYGDCEGIYSEPISGKSAITKYRIVKYCRSLQTPQQDCWMTIVDLFPITGRRHQLRRHMKAIGHPIWGDRRYGYNDMKHKCQQQELEGDNNILVMDDTCQEEIKCSVRRKPFSRLCLWAAEISFPHPITGETMTVCQEHEPEWLTNLVKDQEDSWAKEQDNPVSKQI